ncbi:MAG: helix-turn-helix domain-containing protein [Bacteroidales bacterium]|nr:helix-turn-helix domain-containing protein [Bacteroidales bacterium]
MESLKRIRKKSGKSQEEIAQILNITQGAYSSWETGRTQIDINGLKALSKIFDVSIDELLGNKLINTFAIKAQKLPLLGEIAAGESIVMNEDESYVDAENGFKADFCTSVKGNSMINAGIHDGDFVFIREQPDVNNGEIAAVAINDEATLKRVFKYPTHIVLQSENPKFQPILVFANDGKISVF